MVSVDIEYGEPCGLLGPAIVTQRELLETCEGHPDGVGPKTGDGGVFTVAVDDELVFGEAEHGNEMQLDAIVQAVGEQIPVEANRVSVTSE